MKTQKGFALMQVLVLVTFVFGIIYTMMLTEHTEAMGDNAEKIAVQVTPAAYAIMNYAMSNSQNVQGSHYYGEKYQLSSSYQTSLTDVGYDIGDGVTVSYTKSS